ncbi:MAG: polysaccharide biosynthesis/export family protein [Bacteroidetes bacterium]|nr:polysaccharide biosynthesis/export family protein [Bacteroidota bacterium]MBL6942836.1 polysaccharide biosynthesis/export family protein [Bacteroidales bacterium]
MRTYLFKSFRLIIWVGLVSVLFSSCIPQKKMLYLQVKSETDTLATFKNEKKIEYNIQPGDNLYIRVVTLDEKTTLLLNPFSAGNVQNIGSDASVYLNSYNVSESGYLDFPMIGEILVKNLNAEEIKEKIQDELKTYMKEFIVIVKLVNFNITMIGEFQNPGQYKIYQDNINIFEAVSMARDLTDFADRKKVAIIRQTKTGSEVVYIDMTKRDLLLSDYYYLKPNDILYVQPVKGKQFTFAEFPYGVIFGFISTTILLLNYMK